MIGLQRIFWLLRRYYTVYFVVILSQTVVNSKMGDYAGGEHCISKSGKNRVHMIVAIIVFSYCDQ